jgi:hypothetical protein
MSYELILPFFPEELRELLLDPSISDLMINGTTGVYADRGGMVQHIPLATPYTNDRLQAAIERIARILGQDLTTQNPILNTHDVLEQSPGIAVMRDDWSPDSPQVKIQIDPDGANVVGGADCGGARDCGVSGRDRRDRKQHPRWADKVGRCGWLCRGNGETAE